MGLATANNKIPDLAVRQGAPGLLKTPVHRQSLRDSVQKRFQLGREREPKN